MKKIIYEYEYDRILDILDSKEYMIIGEDNQRISDKYVDFDGKKINEYKDEDELKKGDVIIREFYYIWFGDYADIFLNFRKFKYYEIYRNSNEYTHRIKQGLKIKNSIFNFNYVKKRIVEIFSGDIEIEIK